MADKLHIATISNVALPSQAEFLTYITGNDDVEFVAIRNNQSWIITDAGDDEGYSTTSRARGILPYGILTITDLSNGLLVEPIVLHDDFLGYELELLLNDVVVASEYGFAINFQFPLLNNSIGDVNFTLNNYGLTVYNVGSIAVDGTFTPNATRFSAYPSFMGFDTVNVYRITDTIAVEPVIPDEPVVPGLLIGEGYTSIPELDSYIYANIRDIEFLVGDLVTQRRFKDYIAPNPDATPPILEQMATTVTLSQVLTALQIGASSTLNDVYPSIPMPVEDFELTDTKQLRLRQGLRWCNAYGAAVVLMNSFSREGMPVQSRDSRTRINTLLLIYRTWIEKTIRSLTDWHISITPKPSVYAIGRDFPRNVQRGDVYRTNARPGRGATGTSVRNPL